MRPFLLSLALLVMASTGPIGVALARAADAPSGQMILAHQISIAARWFDPAESEGLITPFIFYYAIHDALVKPMPGNPLAPSLAESWSASADGLTYEFVLRKGARFHNAEPVTADDVKFSFDRYHGAAGKTLKDRVAAVEIVDPHRVRFRLKRPWPDFMTFYGTPATGAGWIVPRKYVAAFGNAATRLDAFVASGGMFTYETYPDIEGLIREQATELDRGKRETILHRIQQLMYEKTMYAPLLEPALLGGFGPRVAESGIGLITNMTSSAPYEDLRIKAK